MPMDPPDRFPDPGKQWIVEDGGWIFETEPRFVASFTASSNSISVLCSQNPDSIIKLPLRIYSAHEVFLDGKLFQAWGDKRDLSYAKKFQIIHIPCHEIPSHKNFKWTVYSPVYQLASIPHFPKIVERKNIDEYAFLNIKVSIGIFLLIFSFVLLLLFWKKTDNIRALTAFATALVFGILLTNSSHRWFFDEISIVTQNKFSANFYLLGVLLILSTLSLDGFLPRRVIKCVWVCDICALLIINLFVGELTSIFVFADFNIIMSAIFHIWALFNICKSWKSRNSITFAILLFYIAFEFCGVSNYGTLHFAALCMAIYQFLRINDIFIETISEKKEFEKKVVNFGNILRNTQMIAHDFKRPITSINMLLNTIGKTKSKPEVDQILSRYSAHIQGTVSEANQMASDLITINSRDLSKKQKDKIDLRSVTQECIDDLYLIEEEKLSRVRISVDLNHKSTVLGVRLQIKRILMNILHNATRMVNENGSISVISKEIGGTVKLAIRNSGSFIDEDNRSKIFEPYYSTRSNESGGLGLALCKIIMDDHKGSIKVNSENQGTNKEFTEFVLVFPLV